MAVVDVPTPKIVPKRFGLKYSPIPTLALEFSNDNKLELLVVELPQLNGDSDCDELLSTMIQQHQPYLNQKMVSNKQLQKLIGMLLDYSRTNNKSQTSRENTTPSMSFMIQDSNEEIRDKEVIDQEIRGKEVIDKEVKECPSNVVPEEEEESSNSSSSLQFHSKEQQQQQNTKEGNLNDSQGSLNESHDIIEESLEESLAIDEESFNMNTNDITEKQQHQGQEEEENRTTVAASDYVKTTDDSEEDSGEDDDKISVGSIGGEDYFSDGNPSEDSF